MEATKDWPSILQFENGATITEAEVDKHYRQVAKKAHPDAGGSNEAMTQVNLAKQLALAWVAREREKAILAQKMEQRRRVVQHHANQYANAFQQQAYANQAGTLGGFYNTMGQASAYQRQQPAYVEYEPAEQPKSWWKQIFK